VITPTMQRKTFAEVYGSLSAADSAAVGPIEDLLANGGMHTFEVATGSSPGRVYRELPRRAVPVLPNVHEPVGGR
jgi:hypothetical protein